MEDQFPNNCISYVLSLCPLNSLLQLPTGDQIVSVLSSFFLFCVMTTKLVPWATINNRSNWVFRCLLKQRVHAFDATRDEFNECFDVSLRNSTHGRLFVFKRWRCCSNPKWSQARSIYLEVLRTHTCPKTRTTTLFMRVLDPFILLNFHFFFSTVSTQRWNDHFTLMDLYGSLLLYLKYQEFTDVLLLVFWIL